MRYFRIGVTLEAIWGGLLNVYFYLMDTYSIAISTSKNIQCQRTKVPGNKSSK